MGGCIARPLGCFMGIENTTSALPNIFSRIYCYSRTLFTAKSYHSASNGHAVDDYKNVEEPRGLIPKSTLDKFAECWFPMTNDVYWYYMFEMSFYWSLIMSQFFDDFWVNFVHHIATILLLGFSYGDSFLRIGALVLLTHDAADPWLEVCSESAGPVPDADLNKSEFKSIVETRPHVQKNGYRKNSEKRFMTKIIYSTLVEGVALVGFYEAYYVFNVLLIILFALHLFWTYLILRIFVSTVRSGQMDDERSDDEDDDQPRTKTNKKGNKNWASAIGRQVEHIIYDTRLVLAHLNIPRPLIV
uniref:TLC domain-containing protein n=1 Tax=Romanomermis culicivorax TaxID=13658 RepID=A0A915LDV9_ROMCU